MMNRGNMGKQMMSPGGMPAPAASRLPVVTGLDKARSMASPNAGGLTRMKKGGMVTRGDGACMKGHTKGTMR